MPVIPKTPKITQKDKIRNTYETSLASRAGPISDRVVNPVALK